MKRVTGKRATLILALIILAALAVFPSAQVPTASAHGTCVPGIAYGGAGTAHNYVKFQVNFNARNWHIEREWWAFYPADLWTYPDGQGVAKAGISGTDWNPPYSPSGYKLCGTN